MGRLSVYINSAKPAARAGGSGGGDGVRVEVSQETVELYKEAMARLLVSDPDTRKRLRAAIRRELKMARNRESADIRGALDNDPRKAYRAVRHAVYKTVLGGNISILSARKAGDRYELLRHRKLDDNPKQRGGNRIPVSDNTYRMETYYGKDRGFVLRFLNSGTVERHTRYGNRGSIAARMIFARTAPWEMDAAANAIAYAFAEEFEAAYYEELNK